jgi:hypothetical protein
MAKKKPMAAAAYEKKKAYIIERAKAAARDSNEIGEIPAVVDPIRRQIGIDSLVRFCEIYLSEQFTLKWSPYH